MGSTGEPERKRRHFSSIFPTAGPAAKIHLLAPCADDKKLDVAVLQYQNQKLFQQLEAQRVEYFLLEDKYNKLKQKHEIYENSVAVINNSWEQLIAELESRSIRMSESANTGFDLQGSQMLNDGAFIPFQIDFLSRLFETNAAESCSHRESAAQLEYDIQLTSEAPKNILQNIISSINRMWHGIENVSSLLRATFLENVSQFGLGMKLQKSVDGLRMQVISLIMGVNDLHLKHRPLTSNIQIHRDMDAELKAEQKRLAGELASTMSELEESNSKLASLRAQRDGSNDASVPFFKLGNKQSSVDMTRNGHKEMQDMEAALKEFKDLAASRMEEIGSLHERKIEILKKMAALENVLVDVKSISSSTAFLMVKSQLDKSKMEMDQHRISLKKLQIEKDSFLRHKKQVDTKVIVADISGKIREFLKSQIGELERELQKLIQERISMETELEKTMREPGRNEIIANFKELKSSYCKEMEAKQSELVKVKDSSSEIHSLRAQVQSLSAMLQRETDKFQSFFDKSAGLLFETDRLHLMIGFSGESEQELMLILEMYRRESTDSWDVTQSREMEYEAWAHVQSLKSSLDEHNLESRAKAAIEAEAIARQRLAAAEAEIADLKQKLELYSSEIKKSTENLESKTDEVQAYYSEIQITAQSYSEMRTQNQLLFRKIISKDDNNIMLVMKGVKERHVHEDLCRKIPATDKKVKEADLLLNLYYLQAVRFDGELKLCSDQAAKLAVDGRQSSVALDNALRRLSDARTESEELRHSLNDMQIQAEKSRLEVAELLMELERERFNKKRIDEGFKAGSLKARADRLVLMKMLRQEISEYREILKCGVCHERQKEVCIAKCYHLFCRQCIQRIVERRRIRKCPTCSARFGPNDIKPIYI